MVARDDIVWVLGDVAMSESDAAQVEDLNGRKHLITGNHDAPFPGHRESHKHQAKWMAWFESIQPFARRRVAGTEFLMSHFPYAADRGEARYTQYRLRDEGAFLLHGHTHSHLRMTSPTELHVGLDAWGLAPVPEQNVMNYLEKMGA